MQPVISVVIPCYEDQVGLDACLASLESQVHAPPFEVIVVDNGSQPPLRLRRGLEFTYIVTENSPGSYAARNAGIREARAELLAFTDADCRPTEQWLASLETVFRDHPDRDIVAGRVTLAAERRTFLIRFQEVFAFDQLAYVRDGSFGATANLACRRSLFDEVGLFDERLRSSGDREWCRRAVAAGAKIEYCGDAVVEHGARSLGELITKERRIAGGSTQLTRLGLNEGVVRPLDPKAQRRRERVQRWPLPLRLIYGLIMAPTRTIRGKIAGGATIQKRDLVPFWLLLFASSLLHRIEAVRLRRGAEPERH